MPRQSGVQGPTGNSADLPYAKALNEAMEHRGVKNVDVARRIGVDPSYVSQMKRGARPVPAMSALAISDLVGEAPEKISREYGELIGAGVEVKGGAGLGLSDQPGNLSDHIQLERLLGFGTDPGPRFLVLPTFLIRQKIGLAPIERVRWLINPSRAMEPEIARGALVLVDTGAGHKDSIIDDHAYAYTLAGRPDVRRILIRRDHWSLAGAGKHSDYRDVYQDDMESLEIHGLVLGTF